MTFSPQPSDVLRISTSIPLNDDVLLAESLADFLCSMDDVWTNWTNAPFDADYRSCLPLSINRLKRSKQQLEMQAVQPITPPRDVSSIQFLVGIRDVIGKVWHLCRSMHSLDAHEEPETVIDCQIWNQIKGEWPVVRSRLVDDYNHIKNLIFVGEQIKRSPPPSSVEKADVQEFVFVRNGDGYFIKGFGESGNFSAHGAKGFHDLYRLVTSPSGRVLMMDLISEHVIGATESSSYQPTIDEQAHSDVVARLKVLELQMQELDPTQPDHKVVAAELQEEMSSLSEYLQNATGIGGKIRDLNGNNFNRMKGRIHSRIRTAIRKLKATCPEVASHFERMVCSIDKAFFTYSGDLEWNGGKKK